MDAAAISSSSLHLLRADIQNLPESSNSHGHFAKTAKEVARADQRAGEITNHCVNESWLAKRGRKEITSNSVNIETATAEDHITEDPGNLSRREWTGLSEPSGPALPQQQHNADRGNSPFYGKVKNITNNVLNESFNHEDISLVKNSFNLSPNSSPVCSCKRNPSCRSSISKTFNVDLQENNDQDIECKNSVFLRESCRCKATNKVRSKRRADGSINNVWPFSQIELMKRRSAEISELRHALEEKINCQNPQYNIHDTVNWDHRLKSMHLSSKKQPSSAYKHFSRENPIENENKVPPNLLQHNTNICISCPGVFRQHDKPPAPPRSMDPRKLKYLMDDAIETSPLKDVKLPGPFLCHRCSSPINFSPHQNPGTIISRGGTADSCWPCEPPAGTLGPRTLQEAEGTRHNQDAEGGASTRPVKADEDRVNYYPNCDPTIWIRTCTSQVIQPLSGIQSGVIPVWLRGALLRNGPGRVQVGEHHYNHVFDGSALLHRFHFRDGRVTYQNKFLESRSYLSDTKAQRIVVNYFGTRAHPDPCKTIMRNIASKFSLEEHFTDNAQISLYPYGDGLYALTETPFIFRVDPETLSTHEKVNLTKHIAVFNHTAHPHVDRDGTVYNIGQGVGPFGPRYHICKFPKSKIDSKGRVRSPFQQAKVVGSVAGRWRLHPCYMHSFAITYNYWVIIEQPLVVSISKIIKVLIKQDALIDALQWWEKETKIHVVQRATGTVTSTQYITDTFFFLHTINAYEDTGHIVLDIAAYKNAKMLQCMFVEALKNAAYDPTYAQMFRGRPKRWVLPLHPDENAGHGTNLITLPGTACHGRWVKKNLVYIKPELLVDIGCEVPRIHYDKYNGRHYQYFYAICSDVDHPCPGTLVKADVVNKTHLEWSEDNVYPSEPIFVPSPGAQREDEGVVLSALLRAKGLDQQVCVLVLDASTFTELGRVEFTAPGPVPKCLHGWWVQEGAFTLSSHHNIKPKTVTKTPIYKCEG